MYAMDKLNLLVNFSPRFLKHLNQLAAHEERNFKKEFPIETLIKYFHTISKSIDSRKPDHSPIYQMNWRHTNSRIRKLVKHGVPQLSLDASPRCLSDLSY
jgi:hypothetical protein